MAKLHAHGRGQQPHSGSGPGASGVDTPRLLLRPPRSQQCRPQAGQQQCERCPPAGHAVLSGIIIDWASVAVMPSAQMRVLDDVIVFLRGYESPVEHAVPAAAQPLAEDAAHPSTHASAEPDMVRLGTRCSGDSTAQTTHPCAVAPFINGGFRCAQPCARCSSTRTASMRCQNADCVAAQRRLRRPQQSPYSAPLVGGYRSCSTAMSRSASGSVGASMRAFTGVASGLVCRSRVLQSSNVLSAHTLR